MPGEEELDWVSRLLTLFVDVRNNATGNHTRDILCKNCVTDYDSVACVRASSIGLLSSMTALLCAMRIFNLHRPLHTDYHKLILFYVLFLQSLIGSLEWLFGWRTQTALFNMYARALELLVICHLYLMLVCRVMNWTRNAATRLPVFGLTLMFMYFTVLLVLGLVFAMEPWRDCPAPYWIWLSAGNLITVQMIVVSFALIIHRFNTISSTESLRRSHRNQLYSLLWVFETSTLVDLGYHVSLYILADKDGGCSSIFKHDQLRYTAVKVPYELISFLLPVWVILIVFRAPAKSRASYVDGGFDSTFLSDGGSRPQYLSNVVVVRNWRRRYLPLGSSQWAFVNPAAQIAAQRPRRSSLRSGGSLNGALRRLSGDNAAGEVRRIQSAPTLISRTVRRNSQSHLSLVSSPLYPIPEEQPASRSHSSSSITSTGRTSIEPVVDST